MSETKTRAPYRRVRNREEWLEVLEACRNDPNTPTQTFEFLQFALRQSNQFPHLKVPSTAPTTVASVVSPVASSSVDLEAARELIRELLTAGQQHSNSISRLSTLSAPAGFNPCPSESELKESFESHNFFLGKEEIFGISQAIKAGKPILADGAPGVGKSETATQIALAMGLDVDNSDHFHKLFCTPDISKEESLYSWNDGKRLLDIQLVREATSRLPFEAIVEIYQDVANGAFSDRYLDLQSLLRPCVIPFRTVVLVDELDKAYPEFDSMMLPIMSENQFEVPGFGPVGRAKFDPETSPIFVVTTNRQRELNGALARRMKPVWFEYLPEHIETKVIQLKANFSEIAAGQIASFFYKIRSHKGLRLHQNPSTAEVIETARSLKEDDVPVTVQNLFRYHCHWCKFRRDIDMVRDNFYDSTTRSWSETI